MIRALRRENRRTAYLLAKQACRPNVTPEGKRLENPINDRTSILPTAVSYKAVIMYRPKDVPANDPKWMGRDWKWKDVKQAKRVTSGSVPDFRTILNDTTARVIARNTKAALRSRGEII